MSDTEPYFGLVTFQGGGVEGDQPTSHLSFNTHPVSRYPALSHGMKLEKRKMNIQIDVEKKEGKNGAQKTCAHLG